MKILLTHNTYCRNSEKDEYASVAVPFEPGTLNSVNELRLWEESKPVAYQATILSRWEDQSIFWIQLHFKKSSGLKYELKIIPSESEPGSEKYDLNTSSSKPDQFKAGSLTYFFDHGKHFLIRKIVDSRGQEYDFSQAEWDIQINQQSLILVPKDLISEENGRYYSCFLQRFALQNSHGQTVLELDIRYHFYPDEALFILESTLRNPSRANHKGGRWDLGDVGSVRVDHFCLRIPLKHWKDPMARLELTGGETTDSQEWELIQYSSGGDNWNSHNHANASKNIPMDKCGYRILDNHREIIGKRAEPVISVAQKSGAFCFKLDHFWENFPKAITFKNQCLSFDLLPGEIFGGIELQGGEQKTHQLQVSLREQAAFSEMPPFQSGLHMKLLPDTDYLSQIYPFKRLDFSKNSRLTTDWLIHAIEGIDSFWGKRERQDEYGWRHFGCLVGDHEAVRNPEIVSHYNNQYDPLKGMIEQYIVTRDPRWWELAHELALHTMDIDIYHTRNDKSAYNGGLFWHTEHYRDAGLATHRTYTNHPFTGEKTPSKGGGPSNEHNYTTGLTYYFFLTGDFRAKEAVLQLADWVLNMEDGSQSRFRYLDRSDTGLSSQTRETSYHGPGRGAGNSINALLDAFILTQNKQYMKQLEKLVYRCIHPLDEIEKNELNDRERRWSYLVFLQVLGRVLDWKLEQKQQDRLFYYIRASLLHYIEWMLKNEVPYTEIKDELDIWTESWPAQEMRKVQVYEFGAKYAPEGLRQQCVEAAENDFQRVLKELKSFKTKYLMRPMVLLLVNATTHERFRKEIANMPITEEKSFDFGQPQRFTSQKERVKRKLVVFLLLFVVLALLGGIKGLL